MTPVAKPPVVALVGCGRLGSALVEGWLATGAVRPADLIILTPSSKPAAEAARAAGARINPSPTEAGNADVVVLAVKPPTWRTALEPLAPHLGREAVVLSVMAGIAADAIAAVARRPVGRVMPTTAVAQARGIAALWSGDERALAAALDLFARVATTVVLEGEAQMDAATAVAGSGPAFVYAFVEALAGAGGEAGLSVNAATELARGALRSAAAGIDTGSSLQELIARIASPGGTTRAGLDAMRNGGDLERAARAAVEAAVRRARTL